MTDVTIPVDVAKSFATGLRNDWPINKTMLADLLDPQPTTLREQVADALDRTSAIAALDAADAVLAVVADWLAAQPKIAYQPMWSHSTSVAMQRDHDVRLIRGGGDRG